MQLLGGKGSEAAERLQCSMGPEQLQSCAGSSPPRTHLVWGTERRFVLLVRRDRDLHQNGYLERENGQGEDGVSRYCASLLKQIQPQRRLLRSSCRFPLKINKSIIFKFFFCFFLQFQNSQIFQPFFFSSRRNFLYTSIYLLIRF